MRTRLWTILTVLAILAAILVLSSLYVVDVTEYAIVRQFGKVVSVVDEPGLHMKTPFLQDVSRIDKRLREWDGEASDLLTVDKENITVNTWARWHVTDPEKYFITTRTEAAAQATLDGVIESSVKNVISSHTLMEVLRNTPRKLKYKSEELEAAEAEKGISIEVGREDIVSQIRAQARKAVEEGDYGITLDAVAIKEFNYVRDVIPKIYERMRSERIRIANRYESEGREKEAEILGGMQKDLEQIRSEGQKESTVIRGRADAKVVRIYAEAFGQDPEFYSFLRSLEMLPEALGARTRVVLSTKDSAVLRFLKSYEKTE